MEDVQMYLSKIRKIIPNYSGPYRGRGKITVLKNLKIEDRKKFMFYENKLKLERNKLVAKNNRLKKKNLIDSLMEENKILKDSLNKLQDKLDKITEEKEKNTPSNTLVLENVSELLKDIDIDYINGIKEEKISEFFDIELQEKRLNPSETFSY